MLESAVVRFQSLGLSSSRLAWTTHQSGTDSTSEATFRRPYKFVVPHRDTGSHLKTLAMFCFAVWCINLCVLVWFAFGQNVTLNKTSTWKWKIKRRVFSCGKVTARRGGRGGVCASALWGNSGTVAVIALRPPFLSQSEAGALNGWNYTEFTNNWKYRSHLMVHSPSQHPAT